MAPTTSKKSNGALTRLPCTTQGCEASREHGVLKVRSRVLNGAALDGSPWRPSSNSRVCSDHFLGLRRVDVQRHPDYLPSVFPDDYSHRSQRFSSAAWPRTLSHEA
ncbi:hypothetical protein ISCGN_025768 [Ixodes scapularis]